jgi:hypothetical protein
MSPDGNYYAACKSSEICSLADGNFPDNHRTMKIRICEPRRAEQNRKLIFYTKIKCRHCEGQK